MKSACRVHSLVLSCVLSIPAFLSLHGAAANAGTPASTGAAPAAQSTATSAAAPVQTASQIVLESNVKSLDAAWNVRHEMHAKIVEFLKKKPALPEDYEVLWRLSRLSYYGGFFALPSGSVSTEKMEIFQVGSEAGDKARKLASGRVEGHYWYAVTLGGWGIAKGILNALSAAKPMRDALTEAIKIDPKYHFAGPLRVRGRLYNKLPGVVSIGDNKLAMEDLKKAVSLAPESKLNHIYLSEVQSKIQSKADALKTLEFAKTLPDVVGVAEESAYRRDISELEGKFR
ncbi:MAG: hypothetical protein RL189_2512 [Pseudomonadota bacterium]